MLSEHQKTTRRRETDGSVLRLLGEAGISSCTLCSQQSELLFAALAGCLLSLLLLGCHGSAQSENAAISLSTSATAKAEIVTSTPPPPVSVKRKLDFRGIMATWDFPGAKPHHQTWNLVRWDGPFWDRENWDKYFKQWSEDGYNAIIWWGPNELLTGDHMLIRYNKFPEAREISPEENEKIIEQVKWIFARAKSYGLKNYLYSYAIWYTGAFAKAHGIDQPMEISTTVHPSQKQGYMGVHNNGVRNALTTELTKAVFTEMVQTYKDLDGFYGDIGESLPGNKASYFEEAIAPALRASGRNPHFIAIQWQIPIENFLQHISPKIYDNLWLGFHAYNSEQITDSKPYSCVTEYAERTGLPTVVTLYPANIMHFPFNSPRFAYEIVNEWRKTNNARGFVYWEWSGRKLSPLFRKALAYYAANPVPYSDEMWVDILEKQYDNRMAAQHLLNAYNISAKIIPEVCALVYCPPDNFRRELRLPYDFFNLDYLPFTYLTSRERGTPLVPVWWYARWVAKDPCTYENQSGTDFTHYPYVQHSIWGEVGGSAFDIIPPVHMAKVRAMGEMCLAEAEIAIKYVKKNKEQAQYVYDYMRAYQLMSKYYERKVAAATAALIYANNHDPKRRAEAERLADEALQLHIQAATFMRENLDPVSKKLHNTIIKDLINGESLDQMMELEKKDRADLATLFHWPKNP